MFQRGSNIAHKWLKLAIIGTFCLLGTPAPTFAGIPVPIDEFKGLDRLEDGENGSHRRLDNGFTDQGSLKVVKGRDKLNTTANTDTTVNGLYYYETAAVTGDCATCELLVSFDGEAEDTTFVDDVGTHTLTAQGDAQVGTALTKFGTGSLLLDGTGDYVSIPDSSDWTLGTNDFTIDLWMRSQANTGDRGYISQHVDSSNFWHIQANAGTTLEFQARSSGSNVIFVQWSTSIANGTYHHIEISREGDTFRAFNQGVALSVSGGSATDADSIPDFAAELQIGAENAVTAVNGNIDELRFDNGTAYNTVNFISPAVPYTVSAIDNQKLIVGESDDLVRYDTDGSNRVVLATDLSDEAWDFVQIGEQLHSINTSDGLYKWNGTDSNAFRNINAPAFPYIEEYKGVLFVAEGRNLQFSNALGLDISDNETFDPNDHIIVGNANQVVTGLKKTSDSLLIFTATSLQELTGFGVATFRLRNISTNIGTVNDNTVEEDGDGNIIFFSGVTGVYKFRVNRSTTDTNDDAILTSAERRLQKISAPIMDAIFQGDDDDVVLNTSDYTSSHAYYDSKNELYFLYIGQDSFIYNNIDGTWAHIPASRMTATAYALSTVDLDGTAYMLDDLGFFFTNFIGFENGVESGTVTGNPTSSTNTTLTDTGATFNTTGDGVTGVWVAVVPSDTGTIQYRQITSNTATELTIATVWDTNPTTSFTYFVGYIIFDALTKQYTLAALPNETDIPKITYVHNLAPAVQTFFVTTFLHKSSTAETDIVSWDLAGTGETNTEQFMESKGTGGRSAWHQWGWRSFVYNISDTVDPPVDILNFTMEATVYKKE